MSIPSPDALLHLATLHLLSQAGFASTSKAASLTLSSVVSEYFKLVARSTVDHALLAGRSKPGVYDVVASLEELGYGSSLDDLYEYGTNSGRDTLHGEGLEKLADYLQEGLIVNDPIAELRVVHDDDLEEDADEAEDEKLFLQSQVKDEEMDVDSADSDSDMDIKEDIKSRSKLRFPSPDFSWLPPIPNPSVIHPPEIDPSSTTTHTRSAVESATVPSAIIDRYRTRIPFASSSLTAQNTYDLLPPPPTSRLPAGTTSLPDLISTYADTKGETSVAIRPNGYRFQALDLLRRQIATPDAYSPHDTLAPKSVVSGPRFTPIAVPPHPVAVNPEQAGILSRLLHSIQSANLPSELRERLTSLRPPLAQKREGQPLTYGPGLRGADESTLLRAQGKEADKDEIITYSYATWDSGPRGLDKFNRGVLPRGKKVIKFVEGEDGPRQEKRKASQPPSGGELSGLTGLGGRTLKIRLGDSLSPAPPVTAGGTSPIPSPVLTTTVDGTTNMTPPITTPGSTGTGPTLKLKFRRDSLDIPEIPNGTRNSPGKTVSPLPPADGGLPPQSLRDSPTAQSFSLTPQTDLGLPHRSARLSASPLNPTVALPSVNGAVVTEGSGVKTEDVGMDSGLQQELPVIEGDAAAQLHAEPSST